MTDTTTKKRVVGAHISRGQKQRLQEIMAERPLLRTAKFTATFTAKEASKEWEKIAVELNAIPGANKSWKAWRKTWQDIFSKIKAKQAVINKSFRQTGGGAPAAPLNEYESSVAALINPRVVSGHEESQESHVEFDFSQISPLPMEHGPRILPIEEEEENFVVYRIADEEEQEQEPPAQGATPKKNQKINMKTLMKEKVKIKQKYWEEKLKIKQKYYDDKLKIMKEQSQQLRNISDSLQSLILRLDLVPSLTTSENL